MGTLLTVLGFASYGMARFMVDGYLAPFRLSYGDVGLQYTDLVAYGALFAVPIACGITLVIWRDRVRHWLRQQRGNVRFLAILVLVNIVLILVLFVGAVAIDQALRNFNPAIAAQDLLAQLITVCLLVFAGVVSGSLIVESANSVAKMNRIQTARLRRQGILPGGSSGQQDIERNGLDGVALTLSAVMLVAACAGFHALGGHFAESVQEGKRVHVSLLGIGMPGLRAEPVALYQPEGGKPLNAGSAPVNPGVESPLTVAPEECLLFLGAADGTAIFYWPRGQSVLRFAMESLSIKERLEEHEC